MNLLPLNMKSILFIILATIFLVNCNMNTKENKDHEMDIKAGSLEQPSAKKVKKSLEIHGDVRIDNYYWLNERENPEVIQYLEAENSYADKMLDHTKDLQDDLYEELIGRIKQTDQSVPYLDNGYYYYTRYEEGKEYPIYCRKRESLENEEMVMLNANELSEGFDYFQIGGRSVSTNNKILAYGVDTLSRRIYTLKFLNLETGELLEDEIPNTTGSAVWANDNQTIFYTRKDDALRPYMIYRHVLGTDPSEDEMVFHEDDDTYYLFIYKSKSKKYLISGSTSTMTSEYRVIPADQPEQDFKVIQERTRGLLYNIAHYGDSFYIRTNKDAQNFRLMKCSENDTEQSNWEEVIPHREDVLLEGMDIFKNYLVLSERIGGISQIRIKDWEGEDHYISFEEDAYVARTSTNMEFDTDLLRISYNSMTTPNTTLDYNMKTRERSVLKQQEVLGGFVADNYESERIMAIARDGTKIPVSLVFKKGIEKDGNNPLLLYGYGSYGASMNPSFSANRISLLDRGFIWAIAHIRGGQEMGRQWYEDGKLLNKKEHIYRFY